MSSFLLPTVDSILEKILHPSEAFDLIFPEHSAGEKIRLQIGHTLAIHHAREFVLFRS